MPKCSTEQQKRYTAKARRRRAADPQKYRRINRKMEAKRRSHPLGIAKAFIYGARTRSKRRGAAMNITPADILAVWPKDNCCPVFGTPFYFGARRGRVRPDTPSLDRVNSKRGYVRGNIAVISWRANDLKRNATAAEIEKLARWLRKISSRGA